METNRTGMKKHFFWFVIVFFGFVGGLLAQEEEDDLGTETVTVVKPYTPTVSDAFKIKMLPKLGDSIELQKKKVAYNIYSVPVASTFTPAKGKASQVEKTPAPILFNSYASLGLGNFSNALADFYTAWAVDARGESNLNLGFKHHSSRGDIESTPLDADFYDTDLELAYTQKDRDLDWSASLGLDQQLTNWYGIDATNFDATTIAGIEERQNYFNAELNGHLEFEEATFKEAELLLRRFWDSSNSAENRFLFAPKIQLPITSELLTFGAKVDYVGGNFENSDLNSVASTGAIDYGQLQVGITPSLQILRDELTLNLGASLVYGLDTGNDEGNFFIFPAVTASYRVAGDVLIAYGGLEGELKQNSYRDFVALNPFVSPTLTIQPTENQFEGSLGIKGQLFSNLSYNVKGSFAAENRKPLFFQNPLNSFRADEGGFTFGNSFQLFYDDIQTLGLFAELNVDVNRNFTLGINAEVYNYDTETGNPAWNLPDNKASLFLDYQIGKQWYFGANLFFVGERQDRVAEVVPNVPANEFPFQIVTLDSYFDANAHLGYRLNEQLSIFLKTSNLANQNYERWTNFRVQGFQALVGASYKFDF